MHQSAFSIRFAWGEGQAACELKPVRLISDNYSLMESALRLLKIAFKRVEDDEEGKALEIYSRILSWKKHV